MFIICHIFDYICFLINSLECFKILLIFLNKIYLIYKLISNLLLFLLRTLELRN